MSDPCRAVHPLSKLAPRLRGPGLKDHDRGCGADRLVYLVPPIASHLSIYIEVLGILAEGLLMLWLLVMGVSVERGRERATQRASSPRVASVVRWG
jgi:hypothetical protein